MKKIKQLPERSRANYTSSGKKNDIETTHGTPKPEKETSSWFQLGLQLMAEGQLKEAIDCFDRTIALNPFNLEAYYRKGKCLVFLNKDEEGIICFEKAFNIKNLETSLKRIRGNPWLENGDDQDEKNNYILGDRPRLNEEDLDDILNKCLTYDTELTSSELNENAKKKMGLNLKSKLESGYQSAQAPEHFSRYSGYMSNLHTDMPMNTQMLNNGLGKIVFQADLEPFDLSLNRYKSDDLDLNMLPRVGGEQRDEQSFIEQLLEYQRSQIDNAINSLIEQHGGCFNYYIDPRYLFKISTLLLKMVLDDYKMDGIIISIDKPAKYFQKILKNNCTSKYQPFFIECNFGSGKLDYLDLSSEVTSDTAIANNPDAKISYLNDNFSLLDLHDAIEMAIQKVVEMYEGEHHFIFIDNIAAFQSYTSAREIKKFISQFEKDLRELNMYGFFMIPKDSINMSLNDSIRNIPKTISNKLSFWDRSN